MLPERKLKLKRLKGRLKRLWRWLSKGAPKLNKLRLLLYGKLPSWRFLRKRTKPPSNNDDG